MQSASKRATHTFSWWRWWWWWLWLLKGGRCSCVEKPDCCRQMILTMWTTIMCGGANNDDKNQFDADRKQFGPAASLYWSSIRPPNPMLGNRYKQEEVARTKGEKRENLNPRIQLKCQVHFTQFDSSYMAAAVSSIWHCNSLSFIFLPGQLLNEFDKFSKSASCLVLFRHWLQLSHPAVSSVDWFLHPSSLACWVSACLVPSAWPYWGSLRQTPPRPQADLSLLDN